jgi:endonuclease IV
MSFVCNLSKDSHISGKKYKTMYDSIKTETTLFHMSAISLFIVGPLNKNKVSLQLDDINKYCLEKHIKIFPHASYISAGIWHVKEENINDNKSMMWLRHVADHLIIAKQLSAKGVVFHLPRHTIEEVVKTMKALSISKELHNHNKFPPIVLECPASRPDPNLTYETAVKLNNLVKTLHANKDINVNWNICIDTCHLFAGGMNFSEVSIWNQYEHNLYNITKSKLKVIHLNGAERSNYATGKDGHVIPMARDDALWGHLISDEFRDYLKRTQLKEIENINLFDQLSKHERDEIKNSSLYFIVKFAKKHDIALIMEINRGDFKDAKFALDTVNSILL